MDIKVLASGSSGNCYLVEDGKSRLLLDAGIRYSQILAGCDFNMDEIWGCLVTHIHKDHSKAVEELIRRGIKVYGPLKMAVQIENVKPLRALKKVSFGTFTVTPFMADHDVACYGYHIESVATGEKLVYLTDTARIPMIFKDINYWLIEANYDIDIMDRNVDQGMDIKRANRVIGTHLGIDQLEDYLDELDTSMANAIYLCHLSADNSNAEDFRQRIQRVTGAPVYIAGGDDIDADRAAGGL